MNANSRNSSEVQDVTIASPVVMDIRQISKQQLAALGVSHIAYLKPVMMDGVVSCAIHAADGTPMAVVDNCEIATAVVMQHEMLPLSVH